MSYSLFFARVDLLHGHSRKLKPNAGLKVLHNTTVNLRAKWIASLKRQREIEMESEREREREREREGERERGQLTSTSSLCSGATGVSVRYSRRTPTAVKL